MHDSFCRIQRASERTGQLRTIMVRKTRLIAFEFNMRNCTRINLFTEWNAEHNEPFYLFTETNGGPKQSSGLSRNVKKF